MLFKNKLCLSGLIILSLLLLTACGEDEKNPTTSTSKNVPIKKNNLIVAPAIVDSAKDIIKISMTEPGIVNQVLVSVGDIVDVSSPLLSLRNEEMKLKQKLIFEQRALEKNELLLARNILAAERKLLTYHSNIDDSRAVSKSEMTSLESKVNKAKLMVQNHKRRLEISETNLELSNLKMDKSVLKSPKKGKILQINVKSGEYLRPSFEKPAVLLGDIDKAYVRVAISTKDIWKFKPSLSAYIKTRGENPIILPLTFLRVDAYAVSQEFSLAQPLAQSDVRSLEILYYFERKDFPQVFPGESFDAYLGEARE